MCKLVKYAIILNAALGLIYAVSSYLIWLEVNNWSSWEIVSFWSPFLVTPQRLPDVPQVQTPVSMLFNVPFVVFWVMLTINLYVIWSLKRQRKLP
jgi:hypothetical protein